MPELCRHSLSLIGNRFHAHAKGSGRPHTMTLGHKSVNGVIALVSRRPMRQNHLEAVPAPVRRPTAMRFEECAMAVISDVARVAGVSKATASRALTGRGYVAEPTRDRVLRAAASLGYVASTAA